MTQADGVHSTPPTNTSALPVDPTRRRLLTTATGGAVAAAIPAAALAAAPAVDPIFAVIDNHKKVMQALKIADAEQERLLALADEAVGPSSIQVLDMREPSTPPGFHPYVEVNCWIDIEKYVPEAEHPDLYAHYRAALEERSAAHSKFLEDNFGDIDKIIDSPTGSEIQAADALAETVPTTLPGLLAVLSYLHGAMKLQNGVRASFDENNLGELFESLATAAKALVGRQQ
jgi:hypothetical protein